MIESARPTSFGASSMTSSARWRSGVERAAAFKAAPDASLGLSDAATAVALGGDGSIPGDDMLLESVGCARRPCPRRRRPAHSRPSRSTTPAHGRASTTMSSQTSWMRTSRGAMSAVRDGRRTYASACSSCAAPRRQRVECHQSIARRPRRGPLRSTLPARRDDSWRRRGAVTPLRSRTPAAGDHAECWRHSVFPHTSAGRCARRARRFAADDGGGDDRATARSGDGDVELRPKARALHSALRIHSSLSTSSPGGRAIRRGSTIVQSRRLSDRAGDRRRRDLRAPWTPVVKLLATCRSAGRCCATDPGGRRLMIRRLRWPRALCGHRAPTARATTS